MGKQKTHHPYLEDGLPFSKWKGSPLFISHEEAMWKGCLTPFRGLTNTMVINHLLNGMILQVSLCCRFVRLFCLLCFVCFCFGFVLACFVWFLFHLVLLWCALLWLFCCFSFCFFWGGVVVICLKELQKCCASKCHKGDTISKNHGKCYAANRSLKAGLSELVIAQMNFIEWWYLDLPSV